ncbi:MAG TPA: ubiquinone-dependent pyruvate dehydrogenase [Nitrososphaeraceae archaeon]|nr:ubiquinone-dependent pyruvate dehydrogenase [Nitrososphaeraceae archaeon]
MTLAKKVADIIVDSLIASGVRRIYGVAGDSLNGITDAVRDRGKEKISWIHVRHEETAAFAAGAEAHLTRELAVCAGSCGPGNTHLINGLYDCYRNRVPVLAIAAHIPSREIGSSYFQETHPELLFKECSHYCELVSRADQIPRILDIAMRTALSRSGVSIIVLPGDVALQEAVSTRSITRIKQSEAVVCPSPQGIAELAEALNSSEKVTILGGAGCAGAHSELITVAGILQAPIVHAMRGKEFIEYENPYDVGMTGLLGFSSGYYAIMNSDLLLMLGTDFPYQQFYPPHAYIVQIDIRGEQIGRRTKVDLGLVGNVRETLTALIPLLKQKEPEKGNHHLKKSLDHYREARKNLDAHAVGKTGHKSIHPQYVAKLIDELASPEAIFTCDVGTPTIWAARYLHMNGKRRLLGSFSHGSMANALPQAIGAQEAFPDRQVICLSGDGGFSMLMGDFISLKQLKIPIKVVVFNNSSLSFVELEMKSAGFLSYATDFVETDFSKLAEAVGILGLRAERPEQVKSLLSQALEHEGPALVDVTVNRQELAMPPTITLEQIKGFTLYMIKAVVNGKGDEVVDLAKTNLFTYH